MKTLHSSEFHQICKKIPQNPAFASRIMSFYSSGCPFSCYSILVAAADILALDYILVLLVSRAVAVISDVAAFLAAVFEF
jgi:hypothetical protein